MFGAIVEYWTGQGNRRFGVVSAEDGYMWGTGRTVKEAISVATRRYSHPVYIPDDLKTRLRQEGKL